MPDRAGESSGYRVLVVDDNKVNAKLLIAALRAEGHAVEAVNAPDEVAGALSSFGPDLVLMDVQLPGKDGLTLTRELRADPANRGIGVIAVTAYARPEDRDLALAAGCEEYISKPVDTRALPEILDRVFAGLPARVSA